MSLEIKRRLLHIEMCVDEILRLLSDTETTARLANLSATQNTNEEYLAARLRNALSRQEQSCLRSVKRKVIDQPKKPFIKLMTMDQLAESIDIMSDRTIQL